MRTDDATGKRVQFCSAIPPWCRKSPKITEVLPLLRTTRGSRRTAGLNLRNLLGRGLTRQAGAWVLCVQTT